MKKVIVLLSGVIIAAGAAAQADKTGSQTTQATRTETVDRQLPINSERAKRENPAAEGPESANIVDPDFQGSSKQEATSSGLGQPKKDEKRTSGKPRSDAHDVEDKTKQ
ncbi:hypothetical protein [Telluria beijingensis]|uniref:hypothetical protein n=1 Tax=Telluria beijingensis TaxID=3068633 RepID=UPI0027962E03|nr:hypothetical protein [Massilia sp. REN29]